MAVSANDIRWVAHLARLEFAEEELVRFTDQFNDILLYVDQLRGVNTEGVEPLAHALPIHNIFRDICAVTRAVSMQKPKHRRIWSTTNAV